MLIIVEETIELEIVYSKNYIMLQIIMTNANKPIFRFKKKTKI